MITHALNTFIVVTILPSVVRDIGGLRFFAWNTTLYVVASLLGGACCTRLLSRLRRAQGVPACTRRLRARLRAVRARAESCRCSSRDGWLQGLGAGTLSALSYTMVRALFAERALAARAGRDLRDVGHGDPARPGARRHVRAVYRLARGVLGAVRRCRPVLLVLVETRLAPRTCRSCRRRERRWRCQPLAAARRQRAGGVGRRAWRASAALNAARPARRDGCGFGWFARREFRRRPAAASARRLEPDRPARSGLRGALAAADRRQHRDLRALFPAGAARDDAAAMQVISRRSWPAAGALSSMVSSSATPNAARTMLLCGSAVARSRPAQPSGF